MLLLLLAGGRGRLHPRPPPHPHPQLPVGSPRPPLGAGLLLPPWAVPALLLVSLQELLKEEQEKSQALEAKLKTMEKDSSKKDGEITNKNVEELQEKVTLHILLF